MKLKEGFSSPIARVRERQSIATNHKLVEMQIKSKQSYQDWHTKACQELGIEKKMLARLQNN